MSMPNVFVVPPEEEDSPPWCFFDAQSDFPSSSSNPSPESHLPSSPPDYPLDSADDSDVIEVVRVARRNVQDQDAQSLDTFSQCRPSNTLKSRASKVFRSLKGSLRSSRSRLQDAFPSSPPSSQGLNERESVTCQAQETIRRPRTSTISRRNSRIISQLFVASPHESELSLDDSPSSLETDVLSSLPLSAHHDCPSCISSCHSSLCTPMDQDEARLSASSPTPTTNSFKTSRRRFSILSLQKLFSFAAHPVATPIGSDDFVVASASISSPSAASSFSTISVPQTPTSTEEVNHDTFGKEISSTDPPTFDSFDSVFESNFRAELNLGVGLGLESGSSVRAKRTAPLKRGFSNPWNLKRPLKTSRSHIQERASPDGPEDNSLEMRLDSLHFDSLSFDADRF